MKGENLMNRVEEALEHLQGLKPGLNASTILFVFISMVLMLMIFLPLEHPAYAAESGASSYTPGSQGDFAMCYYPEGLFFRENIVYTEGTLKKYPVQPGVTADLDSDVWFNLVQILYSSDIKILGGRYFMNINIPEGFDADLSVKAHILGQGTLKSNDGTKGLGDIQVVPAGIIWDKDDLHFLVAQNLVLATGRYNTEHTDRLSMGRNYTSYDTICGFTWLDQKRGHEVSFIAGYMINSKNSATEYKTGNEFHLDYTLAQYLSERFGAGLVGYYYQQLEDDESPILDQINAFNKSIELPTPDGYKSKGAAVGPAIMFSPNICGKNVNLIAKWLHEYYARNRYEGEWVWLSAVVKF
jgi:hypothetical protein